MAYGDSTTNWPPVRREDLRCSVLVVSERLSKLETDQGTSCLLNPTDCVKDRLLWWYLEDDRQCWEQAIDVARHHKLMWNNLKKWHDGEGYADKFESFQAAVKAK
jgi:hypothetical protein